MPENIPTTIEPEASNEAQIPHSHWRRNLAAGVATSMLVGVGVAVSLKHEQEADANSTRLSSLVATQSKLLARQEKTLNRLENTAAGLAGVSREVLEGKGLRSITELPGYGHEVSQADRQTMRAATVKLVMRPKSANPGASSWTDSCTGLKVGLGSSTHIVTAAHCTYLPLQRKGGDGGIGHDPLPQNVTTNLANEYGVVSINADDHRGSVVPITAVAMSYTTDLALMKIDRQAPAAVEFLKTPSVLDYAERLGSSATELPGESTVVFSLPEADGGKVLMGEGVYLGSTADPDNPTRILDLVGLKNVDKPSNDACNYGASGSSAILSSGRVLGPLSTRNNTHYLPGAPQNNPDNPQQSVSTRLKLEEALELDLSSFDTVCGYATGMSSNYQSVIKGFANPAEPLPSYSMK